jgi:hypothetical protein
MATNELLRYWPNEDDFTACIKTVAEASSEAVALAVHQRMTFDVRAVSAEGVRLVGNCDERELLSAFLTDNLPEGRVILPIVGDTGVGKSHVIRWLDAQLQRMPDHERRLVIRIRKGMSLKGILALILEKAPERSFEKYRRDLELAQEAIDPLRAAGQLCEDLAHTLHERFLQAEQRLAEDPTDPNAKELQSYCHPQMLPTLLRSQYLRDAHFVRDEGAGAGPVRRLVEHLTESRGAADDDDRKREFIDDDLRVADHVDLRQLGPAERNAVGKLEREDRRRVVVRILNETLDSATQRLMRTAPAVGELFDAVRQELLDVGKELVLLVEDFVALTGLQRQLLEVIIRDAIRDGHRELCTMRTALAYTAGYAYMPDTVRTRAGLEYVIPNVPGDEANVLRRIVRQVGAYLNAARIGQKTLDDVYRADYDASEGGRGWVPRFDAALEPDDAATIAAFGSSEDGYQLFPFNEQAIRALARETALHDGRVSYNPRSVNQHIIRHVLLRRDDFQRHEFPPQNIGTTNLSIGVTNQVEQRVPRNQLQRYLRALAYWGGRPDDLEEVAQTPEAVFTAFGLDRTALVGHRPTMPRPTPPPAPPEPTSPGPPPPRPEPAGRELDPVFEQWRKGVTMPQGRARELRRSVAGAIGRAVNWDWYLFRPQRGAKLEDWREYVVIPNAPGNEGRDADTGLVAVCSDDDLKSEISSAQITASLSAVHRLHEVHRGSLDYDGADEDLPRYAAFVENHRRKAEQWVLARPFRAEWDPIPAFVQVLLVGGRALGVPHADDNRSTASLIDALFGDVPSAASITPIASGAPGPTVTGVTAFLEAMARCRGTGISDQESWRRLLLEVTAARQGQAEKIHAIDTLRLKTPLEVARTAWDLTADLPGRVANAPTLDRVRTQLSDLKRLVQSVDREAQVLMDWRQQLQEWLGTDFDKSGAAKELRQTLDLLKTEGLVGDVNTSELSQMIDKFRDAAVKGATDAVATLDGATNRGAVLSVIGQRLDDVVLLTTQLRQRFDHLIETAGHEQRAAVQTIGQDPVGVAAQSLVSELERAKQLMEGLQS